MYNQYGALVLDIQRFRNVVAVTMARAPVNAFDKGFVEAWNRCLDDVDPSAIAVLHIRSAQKVFSAGADLKMMRDFFSSEGAAANLVEHVAAMQDVFDRIEALPCVTVAEIGGSALGGGFELALSCDLRIVAHGALVGLPEAGIGLIPGAGGTQRLTRLCGEAVAKRIILGCDVVDGQVAERIGLAQWSVPDAELRGFADTTVARIAGLSTAALGAAKRCIVAGGTDIKTGLLLERLETLRLLDMDDTRQRVGAFLKNRER
jgi:enoyl-CoA hydratase/carnithine racemase